MEKIGDILAREDYRTGTATPNHPPTPILMNSLSNKEQLIKSLGLTSLDNTFDNFKPLPGTSRALAAFKAILDGPQFLLLCFGGVGNGKTHLCEAAAIELYKRGRFCRVMRMPDILSTLRRAINDRSMNYETILANYCYAERLIVDDIGAGGSDSDFGNRILETIVVARYGRQLFTIMTSNQELTQLPERVVSRFKDTVTSYLVLNEGADYRPKKKGKR